MKKTTILELIIFHLGLLTPGIIICSSIANNRWYELAIAAFVVYCLYLGYQDLNKKMKWWAQNKRFIISNIIFLLGVGAVIGIKIFQL